MSKKSRKRNKKILAVLGLAGAAAAAASKRKAALASTEDGKSARSNKSVSAGGGQTYAPKVVVPKTKPSRIQSKPPTLYRPNNKTLASPKWNNLDTSEVNTDYVAPSTKQYNNPDFGFGIQARDGGRIGKKSGGRTGYNSGGAAKRGVSPILLKGKK